MSRQCLCESKEINISHWYLFPLYPKSHLVSLIILYSYIHLYLYIYGISSFYYRDMTTCSTDHPNVVEHLSSMNVMILSILWFASFCWPKGTNYSHVFDFHSDFNRSYSDRLQVKNCLLAFRNGQATYSN